MKRKTKNGRAVRVLLADEQAPIRENLRRVLADMTVGDPRLRIEIVGEAATGEETTQLAGRLRPDVVIMDLLAPALGGIEAIQRVRAAGAVAGILVLMTEQNEAHILDAIRAGAIGTLPKDALLEDFALAVRAASRGRGSHRGRAVAVRHRLK